MHQVTLEDGKSTIRHKYMLTFEKEVLPLGVTFVSNWQSQAALESR